jgi:hypothetical protein
MQTFIGWLKEQTRIDEADTRYSVEINFRSRTDEILKSAAKITLGYASAALKKAEFHVKQIFEEEPYRIMVSSRHWDDGEWVSMASWSSKEKCYIISKGFYNKVRKSVSVQQSKRSESENAAEIANELKSMMHNLKNEPDRKVEKLKKVPLQRGPKS